MANQACVSGSFPGPTENLLVLWLKSQTDTQHYIRHRRSIVLGRFLLSFLIFAVCVVSHVADDGTLLVRCNCAAEMIGTWEDWAGLRDRDRARCLRVGVVGTVISWKTETIVLITLIIMGIWLISKILSAIINPFYYEPLHYLFFFLCLWLCVVEHSQQILMSDNFFYYISFSTIWTCTEVYTCGKCNTFKRKRWKIQFKQFKHCPISAESSYHFFIWAPFCTNGVKQCQENTGHVFMFMYRFACFYPTLCLKNWNFYWNKF